MENTRPDFAKQNFDALCRALDDRKWKYDIDEKSYSVSFKVNGNDLVIDMEIQIDAKRDLAVLFSRMPFIASSERAGDMAQAINFANNRLGEGSFDYNYKRGFICFRMTNSYRESVLNPSVYDRMIKIACNTVDDFNEKFLLLSLGAVSLEACKKMIAE